MVLLKIAMSDMLYVQHVVNSHVVWLWMQSAECQEETVESSPARPWCDTTKNGWVGSTYTTSSGSSDKVCCSRCSSRSSTRASFWGSWKWRLSMRTSSTASL